MNLVANWLASRLSQTLWLEDKERDMKVFGYKEKVLNEDELLQMSEVTFQASPKTLRAIAQFFNESADYLEKHDDFDHAHLQDDWSEWQEKYPDVIIVKKEE